MAFSILVIDRDPTVHEVIKLISEEKDCSVSFAKEHADGSKKIKNGSYSLVFIECSLGTGDGYALTRIARSKNFPVVMMETRPTRDKVLLSVRVGSMDFIVKPFNEDTFRGLFARILANKRLRIRPTFKKIEFEDKSLTPNQKVKHVIEKAAEIMAFPQTASKVVTLCDDPQVAVDKLEEPISLDPAITTMVLKRANSAAFGSSRSIARLRDALVRIGNRETRSMCVLLSAVKIFGNENKGFAFNRLAFWGHSLGVGVLARSIAKKFGNGLNPEDAFLAGMLHDIGKLIFDDYLHDDYLTVCQNSHENKKRLLDCESDYFELSHNHVGSQLVELWKLPSEIVDSIQQHHNSELAKKALIENRPTLSTVTYFANMLAMYMNFGSGGDTMPDLLFPEFWERLGMKDGVDSSFIEGALQELKTFLAFISVPMDKVGLPSWKKTDKGKIILFDKNNGDRSLDMFFALEGYTVVRKPEDGLLFAVYDFRYDDFKPVLDKDVSAKVPNIVICGDWEFTGDLKELGRPVHEIEKPFDLLNLLGAVQNILTQNESA